MRKILFLISILSFQLALSIDVQFNKFTQNLSYESLENAILENPQTLRRDSWGFSAGYSFVEDPLARGEKNSSLTPILSRLHSLQLGVNIAVTERFEFMLNTAIHHAQNNIINQKKAMLGDTSIALKYQLLKQKNFAIAFTPHLVIPTGDSDRYLGGEELGYGAIVSVEKNFKYFGSVFNIGYTRTPDNNDQGVDYEELYHLGVGVRIPIKKVAIQAEYRVNYTDNSSQQRPSEFHLGASYQLSDILRGFVSVGLGNTNFENNNDYRLLAGIKGSFGKKEIRSSSTVKYIQEQLKISRYINFKFASHKIEPILHPLLREIADIIISNKQYIQIIGVHGHTDSNGSSARNQKLSSRRANSVVNYLIELGVNPDLVYAKGFGEDHLKIFPEKSQDDAQVNRRVEFEVFERR